MIDYFRKPYMQNLADGAKNTYSRMMKGKSDSFVRSIEAFVSKHSEFKKPYRADSYEGMEYSGDIRTNCPGCDPVGGCHGNPDPNCPCCFEWQTYLICKPQECIDRFGGESGFFGELPFASTPFGIKASLTMTCIEQWVKNCGKTDFCVVVCDEPDCVKQTVECRPLLWTLTSCGRIPGMVVKGGRVKQLRYGVFDFSEGSGDFEVCCDCGKACGGAGCCAKVETVDVCCNASADCEIAGADTMTTSDTNQLSATGEDCNSISYEWAISGEDATISGSGLITTGASSCGTITVTIQCPDGAVIDTFSIRVSNAGSWDEGSTTAICDCNAMCGGIPCTDELIASCIVGPSRYRQMECSRPGGECDCGGPNDVCDCSLLFCGGPGHCGVFNKLTVRILETPWQC